MKNQKIQKPIDVDAHFKYRCPECGYDYWISLNEAMTKNFKIVCDCKTVFQPKRIDKIKIVYYKSIKKTTQDTPAIPEKTEKPVEKPLKIIDKALRDKCSKLLMQYGFTQAEARELVSNAYQEEEIKDPALLVKKALTLIGDLNE